MATFKKATKYNSFLKMGIAGPEGSGKTYTALNIAKHLSEKRIALIDAEPGSASKYADLFDFHVNELTLDDNDREIEKPFSPQHYMEVIKAAYDSGEFDVLIIDGISPEWDDAGGILQFVDSITKNGNTRDAWKIATPLHRKFVNYILRVRMHVICTMRAKKEVLTGKDASGKITRHKVALDPIQREDLPFVFDIFAIMQNKEMLIDKTRCPELDDQVIMKPGKEVADILKEWLKGDPMPERPEYSPDIPATPTLSIAPTPAQNGNIPASEQQLASIRKLYEHLGKPEPEGMASLGYADAKQMITDLSQEYRQMRNTSPQSDKADPIQKALEGHKNRAFFLEVITDDKEWIPWLAKQGITEIKTGADLARVNTVLTAIESQRRKAS